jgi:hypothetical protein
VLGTKEEQRQHPIIIRKQEIESEWKQSFLSIYWNWFCKIQQLQRVLVETHNNPTENIINHQNDKSRFNGNDQDQYSISIIRLILDCYFYVINTEHNNDTHHGQSSYHHPHTVLFRVSTTKADSILHDDNKNGNESDRSTIHNLNKKNPVHLNKFD